MSIEKENNTGTYIILILLTIVMILPFYWMINTSLKQELEVFTIPPTWIPTKLMWSNYKGVFEKIPFLNGVFNSFYITAICAVGTVYFSSLTAYAFAKMNFRFKGPLFSIYLLSMMIPFQITLIPQFILFSDIGWIDSHLALIIPFIFTNGFGVFMLKQFFQALPDALIESALMDGCNQWRIFRSIMLPQVKPAMASVAVFAIIAKWNDFLGPYVILITPEKFTLPLLINSLQGFFSSNWAQIMAATTMSIIPLLVIYIFAQQYFIEGISLSGIKG
jgi:multiple sugar transport system permease protein